MGEKTCFLASDSTYKDRAKNAVASHDIETAIAKLKSQKLCAIMDVDYKGIDHGKEVVPDPNHRRLAPRLRRQRRQGRAHAAAGPGRHPVEQQRLAPAGPAEPGACSRRF